MNYRISSWDRHIWILDALAKGRLLTVRISGVGRPASLVPKAVDAGAFKKQIRDTWNEV